MKNKSNLSNNSSLTRTDLVRLEGRIESRIDQRIEELESRMEERMATKSDLALLEVKLMRHMEENFVNKAEWRELKDQVNTVQDILLGLDDWVRNYTPFLENSIASNTKRIEVLEAKC